MRNHVSLCVWCMRRLSQCMICQLIQHLSMTPRSVGLIEVQIVLLMQGSAGWVCVIPAASCIVRFSSEGRVLWNNTDPGASGSEDVSVTSDNRYIFTGNANPGSGPRPDSRRCSECAAVWIFVQAVVAYSIRYAMRSKIMLTQSRVFPLRRCIPPGREHWRHCRCRRRVGAALPDWRGRQHHRRRS